MDQKSSLTPRTDVEAGPVVVAIAASAGGLEATSLLARNLSENADACFVIAQHMSPTHKSMLVQLLARETRLRVIELDTEVAPVAGVIYIPPPGHDVVYEDGRLHLREPSGHPASPKPSADRLFTSLAESLEDRTIGVVLSGTGSDGSYGIRAIREHGGITIAQQPETCKYASMPEAAIRTGCIDLTLTPQQIGEHIEPMLATPRDLSPLRDLGELRGGHRDLFDVLLSHTLVDFSHYKETTVNRRIQRRMIALRIDRFEDYVSLCRTSTEEVDALYRDLLISVTRFFRDPDQFHSLGDLLSGKAADGLLGAPVRVWVPGCATGEEAYSIAILVCEALGGLDKVEPDQVQIFATDIDDAALAVARRGVYPVAALADIPAALQEPYFLLKGEEITVRRKLRSMVMFSRHNVFQDAPFTSIDLVSIRNVLIYFDARLQERVLTRISYALRPDGLLFLGTSETLGALEMGFTPAAPPARLFEKSDPKPGYRPQRAGALTGLVQTDWRPERTKPRQDTDEWRLFDILARSVVSDGFLVDRNRLVLRVYGNLAPFCDLTGATFGKQTLDILKKPFSADAASLALVALKTGETRRGAWHELPGDPARMIQITATPVHIGEEADEQVALIGFETQVRRTPTPAGTEASEYVGHLEEELARTRSALQVTVEQLQTSNEELQSVNEELQSSNEELESSNEELETANEELQSTNEELITVNEELLVNTGQLEKVTAELNGLVENLPAITMMVDQGLVIRYASKKAIETFKLRERGPGYGHLSQCDLPAGFPHLVSLASDVIVARAGSKHEFQIGTIAHELDITPFEDQQHNLGGLVVMVQRIDRQLKLKMMEMLSDFGGMSTWKIDMTTGAREWSPDLIDIYGGFDPDTPVADSLAETVHPDDRARTAEILQRLADQGGSEHYFVRITPRDKPVIVAESVATAVDDPVTGNRIVVGVTRDFTSQRTSDLMIAHFEQVTEELGIGFYSYDVIHDLPYWNAALHDILEVDRNVLPTVNMALEKFDPEARARVGAKLERAIAERTTYDYVEEMPRNDGSRVMVRGRGEVAVAENGDVTHVYGSFQVLGPVTSD